MKLSYFHIKLICNTIQSGGVIAYPTEAVYGLGCDPLNKTAVDRILAMKNRPVEKGLILIASDLYQLEPYIENLPHKNKKNILQSWPGHTTWILPARESVPYWIKGNHNSIAVRISAHPVVQQICQHLQQAIISTSANRSGQPPIKTALAIHKNFHHEIDYLVPGQLGKQKQPSMIKDGISNQILRNA